MRQVLALTGIVAAAVALGAGGGCGNGSKTTATITAADTADQVLFDMTHYVTVEGIQRAKVHADTAYFYSLPQQAELSHVTITFFDVRGAETSTMRAREGTYHWRTGDMEGRGNVVVVTTDGRTLKSEVMRFSQTRNEVSSDRAFVFDAPSQHIEGEGFTSDPSFRNLTAKRPRGTGGQLTLPNR
jgi:LPS export ABC transporter protein LptC